MKTTVVGLFPSKEITKKVTETLENSGFKNEDYIIYKTEVENNELTFWQKIFFSKIEENTIENDKLIMSVEVNDENELQSAKQDFENNGAIHVYEFKDMSIEEAKSLDYIKKIVELRAKSEVYAMPEVSASKAVTLNPGIVIQN